MSNNVKGEGSPRQRLGGVQGRALLMPAVAVCWQWRLCCSAFILCVPALRPGHTHTTASAARASMQHLRSQAPSALRNARWVRVASRARRCGQNIADGCSQCPQLVCEGHRLQLDCIDSQDVNKEDWKAVNDWIAAVLAALPSLGLKTIQELGGEDRVVRHQQPCQLWWQLSLGAMERARSQPDAPRQRRTDEHGRWMDIR